jgi:hypothetical protein
MVVIDGEQAKESLAIYPVHRLPVHRLNEECRGRKFASRSPIGRHALFLAAKVAADSSAIPS